jgi:hypothetical protein
VFGIGRRKTQGQLAKAELNQSIGHLMQAATYAAKGAGATVGPRVQVARGYVAPTAAKVRDRATTGWGSTLTTLAPLAAAARDGASQAGSVTRKAKAKNMRMAKKKKNSRRGGMMTGLLAAGTIVGLAGAMAMRRRREQQEWAEYDPTRAVEPVRDEVDTLVVETPSASNGSTPGSTGDKAKQLAGKIGEEVSAKTAAAKEVAKPSTGKATAKGDGVIGSTPTPSGNNRS